jgi:hypothetical protein
MTMIHVMYYYTPEELCRLLGNGKKNTKLIALVHRHQGKSGKFNNGEQEWVRNGDCGKTTITQTNIKTGVQYTHEPLDWIFEKNSWEGGEEGLAWDVNMVCDDSYVVTMTRYHKTEIHTPDVELHPYREVKHDDREIAKKLHQVINSHEYLVKYGKAYVEMPSKNLNVTNAFEIDLPSWSLTLVNAIRTGLMGKPRTAEVWRTHLATSKQKIKAYEEKNQTTVPFEVAESIIKATFWMDINRDLKFDSDLFDSFYADTLKAKKLYELGGHAGERMVLGHAIDAFLATNSTPSAVNGMLAAFKSIIISKN